MLHSFLFLAALVLGAPPVLIPVAAAPPPPQQKYCPVIAFRDYEVLIGRAALVRPIDGCNRAGLIRKVSDLNGAIYLPSLVPPNIATLYRPKIWLFLSHLETSLDGETWVPLRLIP